MSTLVRDVERPAFLDCPDEAQLPLGGTSTVTDAEALFGPRQNDARGADPPPLSDRLRREQGVGATARAAALVRTSTARGGETTLDELFVGAWEGLSARHSVTCPVCAGPMQPRAGADGGACSDCGAQLW